MKKEFCDHCGASMMSNEYTLSRTLVTAMWKLKSQPTTPIRDLGFTKSEYAVVSKLKHWGFAYKISDGVWKLTEKAVLFLEGKIKVPKKIRYFRDEVIAEEGVTDIFSVAPTEESKQKYKEAAVPMGR